MRSLSSAMVSLSHRECIHCPKPGRNLEKTTPARNHGDTAFPGWVSALIRSECLPDAYAQSVPEHIAPLARRTYALYTAKERPIVVGIAGAQGSGKTTLALFLEHWLRREEGLRCATLSLDDVYLGHAQRQRLARRVHPLLATRGVPGTHDVALAEALLDDLARNGGRHVVKLPVFDKARDDRAPAATWPTLEAPVDVVLFEGWCVGACPQLDADLQPPVNELEAREDPDGRWRRYANQCLAGDYARLFSRLDALVMLRVPSFERVLEWRRLQEQKLRARLSEQTAGTDSPTVLSDAGVARFTRHFERLTRHMLKTMPARANTVIDVDDEHRLAARRDRDWVPNTRR